MTLTRCVVTPSQCAGYNMSTSQESGKEEKFQIVPCEVCTEEESDESLSPATLETVSSDDSFDPDRELFCCYEVLDPFPAGMDENIPDWFKQFYNVYQSNENRKYILMQQMHLQMIDFEIKKCELLRDIINKLKD